VIARTRSGDPMKLRWTESHQKFLKDLSLGELISVLQKGVLWELAIHDYEGITDLERRLSGKRIAVLVADGFEQAELAGPMQALRDTGAEADIVSPANNSARGRCFDEWGDEFRVDVALQSANVEDYDGLLLPGGITNSDALRTNKDAVRFVKAFYNRDKPIAALCYGVRILIEARVAQGHRLSSCKELKTDLEHAGAKWINEPVVVDDGLVTGRRPDDIPLFNRKMIEMFACA
jgi:protease I